MDEVTWSEAPGQRPGRRLPSLRGSDGLVDLRRLKVLSVVVPAGFIVAVEWLWFLLDKDPFLSLTGYVALGVASVLSVAGFAALMFHFIDRAQWHVLRQNRDLSAANAVAAAVRGEQAVAEIADSALRCMLRVSGAAGATIELTGAYAGAPDDAGTSRWRWDATPDEFADASGPSIEVPLSSSTAPVGRMTMRLPLGATERDCLSPHTLRSIGLQVGSAIQIAHLIEDMERRKNEGHGFYDVLMRISNQDPLPDVLAAVVKHARVLLHADESALCLEDEAARLMSVDGAGQSGHRPAAGVSCLTSDGGETHHLHRRSSDCPSRSPHRWVSTLAVPVGSAGSTLGEVWVGRRAGDEFVERDRAFLEALSGLAAIAITSARVRESESQRAVLVERDRIAREMHDSLAQVLGVAHLRLRVLDSRADVRAAQDLSTELALLADMCEEAYRDVREAILGLRESSRTDRDLLGNLQVYLAKYSQQAEIDTVLRCSLDHPLELPPPTEVQVVRVIQEALTNVRKHAAATSVTVRIDDDPPVTTFTVEDDGRGFDIRADEHDHDGFGMYTMRERIRALGGTLTIDSAPGRGTRVIAKVPTLAPVDRLEEATGGNG